LEHVEVFRMGSVGTSILEDLDPSPPPTPRDPDLHSQLRRAAKHLQRVLEHNRPQCLPLLTLII